MSSASLTALRATSKDLCDQIQANVTQLHLDKQEDLCLSVNKDWPDLERLWLATVFMLYLAKFLGLVACGSSTDVSAPAQSLAPTIPPHSCLCQANGPNCSI